MFLSPRGLLIKTADVSPLSLKPPEPKLTRLVPNVLSLSVTRVYLQSMAFDGLFY